MVVLAQRVHQLYSTVILEFGVAVYAWLESVPELQLLVDDLYVAS